MAILTKFTLGRLCTEIDIKIDVSEAEFQKIVYPDSQVFYILNNRQQRFLFVYAQIIDDAERFHTKYYQFVEERTDNKIFVNERAGKLNFHLNILCDSLNRKFKDFIIPKSIRDSGDEAIEEYRSWFNGNNFFQRFDKEQIRMEEIILQFNEDFPAKYDIEKLDVGTNLYVEIANSGKGFAEDDFVLEDFQLELNAIKSSIDTEFDSHEWRRFSKHAHLWNESDEVLSEKLNELFYDKLVERHGLDNLRTKLRSAHSMKNKLILCLQRYLRWTYNFRDKDFDIKTLENFGLKCCWHCMQNQLNNP